MTRSLLPIIVATVAMVTACGSSDSASSNGQASNTTGETVYQERCASCHGSDLGGTDKGPSHLSIVYEPNHHNDDSFRSAITNGATQHHWPFGDMPAIDGLSDDDVDAVIAYIRTEQERQGFES